MLVNVFCGILNCATFARGAISAFKNATIPVVVRLEGTCKGSCKKEIELDQNIFDEFKYLKKIVKMLDESKRMGDERQTKKSFWDR